MKSSSKLNKKKTKRIILATMQSKCYYDIVDDVHAKLSSDAHSLLSSGHYISIFQGRVSIDAMNIYPSLFSHF